MGDPANSADSVPATLNRGSKITPYFTPEHAVSPGTPLHLTPATPTLFTPLTIRGATLRNRIAVSPMCQYSTAHAGPDVGALTDYHIATLGHYALKGAGCVIAEATGVEPRGRISPNCPGLWTDAQEAALKRVLTFVRSQGAAAGVQLAHAGRKGSTTAPWVGRSVRAGADVGGWPDDVVGPTGGPEEAWDGLGGEGRFCVPRALREAEMPALVEAFAPAARRAARAGADLVEIHSAHGYLLHQFLSPVTNRRTDGYGGSFEGRTRLLREVVGAVRAAVGERVAVFVRISTTDWLEGTDVERERGGSWTVDQAVALAKLLPGWGADLLDASSGGNHPAQRTGSIAQSGAQNDYQTRIAARIRREVRAEGLPLLVGAVGLVTEAGQARDLVQAEAAAAGAATDAREGREPAADVVLIARQFMREPEWVFKVANELGVDVAWPSQFLRVRLSKA